MKLIMIFLVFVAGVMAPTQAGVNAQLSHYVQSNILAALVSFFVGTLGLIVYALLLRLPLPPAALVGQAPAWVWLGGLCGAFLVTVTITAVPVLGATTMISFLLAGQMCASVILDHFGLLGYPVQSINLYRVLGILLVLGGALLIKNF